MTTLAKCHEAFAKVTLAKPSRQGSVPGRSPAQPWRKIGPEFRQGSPRNTHVPGNRPWRNCPPRFRIGTLWTLANPYRGRPGTPVHHNGKEND